MVRGEVWLINLDPTVGAEIRKTRPAVIVNDNAVGALPLKIIVPLTTWQERNAPAPWMIKIVPDSGNGLDKPSAADTFQIRSLAQERLIRKLGHLSEEDMSSITSALALVLSIDR